MKTLTIWTERFMEWVLILLCVCLAAYLPGQIGVSIAIDSCPFFNWAVESSFIPALPKRIEYGARKRFGCPVPDQQH